MPSKPVLFTLLLIVCVVAVGCRRSRGPQTPLFDADTIKSLVAQLGKKGPKAFGTDPRAAAAIALGDVGPAAKEYGAVEALQKLVNDKDPRVAEEAKKAIAKINAQ
ncbi:MAG: HEAT repeat domain-containing protein [Planctomycetia bacterium]|nr:HEAT repeat domain-containing protein [Planctomycetia bacterium]